MVLVVTLFFFFLFQETSEYMVLKDEMELEMDELNQHECMASMTTLIKHMQRNQITPKVEEASISQKDDIASLIVTHTHTRGSHDLISSFFIFHGYIIMRPVWLGLFFVVGLVNLFNSRIVLIFAHPL